MSEQVTQDVSGINRKLLAIMKDVGAIEKSHVMDMGKTKYNYRGIDDLYSAVHPARIKHGVNVFHQVVPGTYNREVRELESSFNGNTKTRLTTMVSFIMAVQFVDADTGSAVVVTVPAEGYDDGDKACGKAVTYGLKNAWFHVLSCPTEDDTDHERPDTTQDPEAVVTKLVQRMTAAPTMAEVTKAFQAAPGYAKKHPDVIAAGKAAKERFA